MKLKLTFFSTLLAMLFSGCGFTSIYSGLSIKESKEYPLVMIANSDITCSDGTISLIYKKGAIFGTHDISSDTYIGVSGTTMIDSAKREIFPKSSLFLSALKEESAFVFGNAVYPNGQFVFDGGGRIQHNGQYNKENDKLNFMWIVQTNFICKHESKTPFTPKRNHQ